MRAVRLAMVAVLLAGMVASAALAQAVSYHGCVDARGRTVASVTDTSISTLAQAGIENGQPVIRHNPTLPPQLTAQARFFFFTHECARIALNQPLDETPSLERAQHADCWAITTLRASQVFTDSHAERTLEAELNMLENAWPSLTGPPRSFNFAACVSRGVLRLPDAAPPSASQSQADRCVQICGDRLWQCQNRCRTGACRASCEATFDHCEAGCAGR